MQESLDISLCKSNLPLFSIHFLFLQLPIQIGIFHLGPELLRAVFFSHCHCLRHIQFLFTNNEK